VYAKMRRNSLLYLSFRIQSTALAELQNASSVSNRFWDWWN